MSGAPLLGDTVRVRDRAFPTNLLAPFPAVGGVPTVVIKRAENTQAKTSSKWVATLQHEHLHQPVTHVGPAAAETLL